MNGKIPKWRIPVANEGLEFQKHRDLIRMFLATAYKRYGIGLSVGDTESELSEALLRAIRIYDDSSHLTRRQFYRVVLSRSLRCRGFYSKGVVNTSGGEVVERPGTEGGEVEPDSIDQDILILAGVCLSDQNWAVVQMLFFEGQTLYEVAAKFKKSHEWVRQRKIKSLRVMREWFQDQGVNNMHDARNLEI